MLLGTYNNPQDDDVNDRYYLNSQREAEVRNSDILVLTSFGSSRNFEQMCQITYELPHINYPNFHSIYLTVNIKNTAARACYLGGGVEDNGDTYMAGVTGPAIYV